MNLLIDDWVSFCDDAKTFDKSHFFTLFHTDYSDQELSKIFRYFPCADKLSDNMKRFRLAWRRREASHIDLLSENDACKLAMSDLYEKSFVFEEFCEFELKSIVDNVKPIVLHSSDEFENASMADWPNREMQVVLGDYFYDKWKVNNRKFDALLEAFYGAANSYDIQWYLGMSLMDSSVDFERRLILWEAGYDTALTENDLVVFNFFRNNHE